MTGDLGHVGGLDEGGYLSAEWFSALHESVSAAPSPEGAPVLSLGVLVTGVPPAGTEVGYLVRLGGGKPASVTPGTVDGADVVLVQAFEDARALASRETTAGALLESGRITVRGDVARLVAAGEVMTAIGASLATAQDSPEH